MYRYRRDMLGMDKTQHALKWKRLWHPEDI